jgi:hypothetical protein
MHICSDKTVETGLDDVEVTENKKRFYFGRAPFFVSPARHGEAQDMSGT